MTPNAPYGWIAIACIHLNHLELELLPAKIVLATGMGYTMLNARPRCHFHCVFPGLSHTGSLSLPTLYANENPFGKRLPWSLWGFPRYKAFCAHAASPLIACVFEIAQADEN
jgi:hypothetical protein